MSINNNEIRDVLDYRFYLAECRISLRLLRGGKPMTVVIRKEEYDDIGLCFETPLMDKKRACRNKCVFCFIDQNPHGMRSSVYFKDDDSRLSFLQGNYITLTNMTDKDVERIVKMRFSPINISIHTTNPALRVAMMKNPRAGETLKYLKTFRKAGLSMCGQIVLCRGINDGDELARTLHDLAGYAPELGSVSVVPAGLTAHREGLCDLTDFSSAEAGEVIDAVNAVADRLLAKTGTRLFFVADEFYLKAGRPLPDAAYYEGYPQIENGVGLLRSFAEDAELGLADAAPLTKKRHISIATGVAAYPLISGLCEKMMQKNPKLQITVYKIINNFFGTTITVAGLLTGKDIFEQLKNKPLGEELFIPETALRREDDDFLCGMTRAALSEKLGVPVTAAPSDGYAWVKTLLGQ